ncbi:hypothetical protein E2562_005004 [Oryza meyeriana var. granulata]|uniref:Uncharacterized protein n=1 Tax=Oryza meyeriana var. granulata TaxID=110450 RepID=A0A6G1C4X1_9ORYZ|nr:hypothetical protein E2562_005004 [Oryza meyeriana var. granulata]
MALLLGDDKSDYMYTRAQGSSATSNVAMMSSGGERPQTSRRAKARSTGMSTPIARSRVWFTMWHRHTACPSTMDCSPSQHPSGAFVSAVSLKNGRHGLSSSSDPTHVSAAFAPPAAAVSRRTAVAAVDLDGTTLMLSN